MLSFLSSRVRFSIRQVKMKNQKFIRDFAHSRAVIQRKVKLGVRFSHAIRQIELNAVTFWFFVFHRFRCVVSSFNMFFFHFLRFPHFPPSSFSSSSEFCTEKENRNDFFFVFLFGSFHAIEGNGLLSRRFH